jgi:putative ATP-dependent endonuclease of OLD family
LDGNISAQRRRLQPEDLAAGLTFAQPEHVLISVEFSDFAGRPNEEALPFTAVLENGKARLSYRFRPKATTRDALEQIPEGGPIPGLKIDDYVWEIAAGGDNIDLNTVSWNESFGTRFSTDNLQQGYLVVIMEALRDVENRLAAPRTSPLQQIVEQRNIPDDEKARIVQHLQTANANINASATIRTIGTQLSNSFKEAAGKSFAMGVSLGLGESSFTDISRGLRVLLSGYGLDNLDPARNGLGLNNVLYISMLLNYFEGRVAEQRTAGQLLLVEEPEAHLHPQLQRVLLATLQRKNVQVFITTHSTHVTSGVPLSSHVVLTSTGGPVTTFTKPTAIPALGAGEVADRKGAPRVRQGMILRDISTQPGPRFSTPERFFSSRAQLSSLLYLRSLKRSSALISTRRASPSCRYLVHTSPRMPNSSDRAAFRRNAQSSRMEI